MILNCTMHVGSSHLLACLMQGKAYFNWSCTNNCIARWGASLANLDSRQKVVLNIYLSCMKEFPKFIRLEMSPPKNWNWNVVVTYIYMNNTLSFPEKRNKIHRWQFRRKNKSILWLHDGRVSAKFRSFGYWYGSKRWVPGSFVQHRDIPSMGMCSTYYIQRPLRWAGKWFWVRYHVNLSFRQNVLTSCINCFQRGN